jgi:hypothetical protein
MHIEGGDTSIGDDSIRPSHLRIRLVNCTYKVLLNGEMIDEFYDVRDAIAAARLLKAKNLSSQVRVSDGSSGRLVIKV